MPSRYLISLLVPLSCLAGLYFGGWLAPSTVVLGFVLTPILELLIPIRSESLSDEEIEKRANNPWFDRLLYLHVIFIWSIAAYFIYLLATKNWSTYELTFAIINTGILFGVGGINVAHELGHRQIPFDQWMAKLLLLPVLYSHFTLEHNYGHHVKVGTRQDPATARYGEDIYSFFVRSITLSYLDAWKIGALQARMKNKSILHHPLIIPTLIQVLLLIFIAQIAGLYGMIFYFSACVIGWLSLQCVNYIEHYGLLRQQLASGRFEVQSIQHSWNSDHEIGRILLFELVRHPDHHAHTTKTYPELQSQPESPQLPFGYPMSILLALVPPLWFYVMNPRIKSRKVSLPLPPH